MPELRQKKRFILWLFSISPLSVRNRWIACVSAYTICSSFDTTKRIGGFLYSIHYTIFCTTTACAICVCYGGLEKRIQYIVCASVAIVTSILKAAVSWWFELFLEPNTTSLSILAEYWRKTTNSCESGIPFHNNQVKLWFSVWNLLVCYSVKKVIVIKDNNHFCLFFLDSQKLQRIARRQDKQSKTKHWIRKKILIGLENHKNGRQYTRQRQYIGQ